MSDKAAPFVKEITPRSEDFPRWYTDVIRRAELAELSGYGRGLHVPAKQRRRCRPDKRADHPRQRYAHDISKSAQNDAGDEGSEYSGHALSASGVGLLLMRGFHPPTE